MLLSFEKSRWLVERKSLLAGQVAGAYVFVRKNLRSRR
jgi:hypothetical protein